MFALFELFFSFANIKLLSLLTMPSSCNFHTFMFLIFTHLMTCFLIHILSLFFTSSPFPSFDLIFILSLRYSGTSRICVFINDYLNPGWLLIIRSMFYINVAGKFKLNCKCKLCLHTFQSLEELEQHY